jgi:hypothetical protein
MRIRSILLTGFTAILLSIAPTAWAGIVSDTVQGVAGPLQGAFDACQGIDCYTATVLALSNRASLLINILAVALITIAAFRLLVREEEEQMTKAKRTIGGAVAAIILFYLAPRMIEGIYGVTGENWQTPAGITQGVSVLSDEILGVIRWAEVLFGVTAIITIILSGLTAVTTYGSDDGPQQIRNTVFGVVGGIILLITRAAVKATLGLPEGVGLPGNPSVIFILQRGVEMLNTLLTFSALAAVAVIVYAGVMVILNVGSEEEYTKSKALIIRACIGLFIILISLVISRFVIGVVTGTA